MSAEPIKPQTAPAGRALVKGGLTGFGDKAFAALCLTFSLTIVIIILWIGFNLYRQALPSMHKYGMSVFRINEWDVPNEKYGVMPFILATLYSSLLALLIAVPVSVGSALFLTEVAPRWLSTPLSFIIEMLAAVPSVVYGLWGFLVLCPLLNDPTQSLGQYLADHFGSIPLFEGPPFITNVLAAGFVLAIMITPFITSVSREVIRTVPAAQREASLGLGATRWETISKVVLKASQSGIIGSIMLGLGRALGETMAVIMVIGNTVQIPRSLLQPAYTMPGLLALQFKETFSEPMQSSMLMQVAFYLFLITLLVNALARLLILLTSRNLPGSNKASNPIVDRCLVWFGIAIRWGLALAVIFALVYQIVHDVKSHGTRGLFGPIEILVVAAAAIRAINEYSKGKSIWIKWRKVVHWAMYMVVSLCSFVGCLALGFLLVFVISKGFHSVNVNFFTKPPGSPDDPTGGMLNGIVGTLILIGIAAGIGIPIGILGGIYLAEYRTSKFVPYIRFCTDVLNGIPSVVMGIFGYTLFVLPFHHFSAWAGGATLGLMMIPTIIRTTEEMLRLVPDSLREASLGLGGSRLATIMRIVVPAASSGIVTGILLSLARIAGETAPLLFTAFGNDQVSTKLSEPISSMTMEIYNNYTYGGAAEARAWAGALVLLLMVLIISILARIATRKRFALK